MKRNKFMINFVIHNLDQIKRIQVGAQLGLKFKQTVEGQENDTTFTN